MYKFRLFLLLVPFFCIRCDVSDNPPDYSKGKHGIYYQLLTIGEGGRNPEVSDYITVDLEYKTIKDSVFFKARRKFQVRKSNFHGSIDECFLMLREGESGNFIISTDDFFSKTLEVKRPSFMENETKMIIYISLKEVQTEVEYNREKEAFLSWIDDFGEYERVILKQYFDKEKLNIKPNKDGFYYIQTKRGNGKKVVKGDTITVNYEGKFLNGKYFDSTVKRKEPFQFVYGQKWQVIEGLEKAFGIMEEGEKGIVIIQSELGWGQKGSSTGIIPPFTSLIFEVEMLEVKKAE